MRQPIQMTISHEPSARNINEKTRGMIFRE